VLIPPVETVRYAGVASAAYQYDLPVQVARDLLNSLHVGFVDTSAALVKCGFKDAFLPVDGHLSARGNAIVTDGILENLERDPAWK